MVLQYIESVSPFVGLANAIGGEGFGKINPSKLNPFSTKYGLERGKKNISLLFNKMRRMLGNQLNMSTTVGQYTIGAGNTKYVAALTNIATMVNTYFTSDETIPMMDIFNQIVRIESPSPFIVTGFVVLEENGESYTNGSRNTNDIMSAIQTGLAAQTRNIVLGPSISALGYYVATSQYYNATIAFDLAKWFNLLAVAYRQDAINEELPKVLEIGIVISGIASAVHDLQMFEVMSIHQEMPDIIAESLV